MSFRSDLTILDMMFPFLFPFLSKTHSPIPAVTGAPCHQPWSISLEKRKTKQIQKEQSTLEDEILLQVVFNFYFQFIPIKQQKFEYIYELNLLISFLIHKKTKKNKQGFYPNGWGCESNCTRTH